MHEYSTTDRVVRIVNETARLHHARKVLAVNLVVGENSGLIPDSIQFYYDIIARDTAGAGAELRIRHIKAVLECNVCAHRFERPLLSFACPLCGNSGKPTDTGNECYIESLELDMEDDPHEHTECTCHG